MGDSSDSSSLVLLSDTNIRLIQANLEAQLQSLNKRIPDADFMDTYNVCEKVRDKVLNYEDEPHLSKCQNNWRRISIASDLFIGICSIYGCVVDYEFTKIIKTLVQWEKYRYISQRITKRIQLELKKEKYFVAEAQSKLQKSLEGAEDKTSEKTDIVFPSHTESSEFEREPAIVHEKEISHVEQGPDKTSDKEILTSEINENLQVEMEPDLQHSARDNIATTIGNLTEIRAESDTSMLQLPTPQAPREVNSFPSAVPEIPIGENNVQENTDEINQILQILQDYATEKPVEEVEQPETLLETPSRIEVVEEDLIIEKSPTFEDESEQTHQLENFEEWNLPDLEPVKEIRRKPRHLIIDETITIRNYSERALSLNSRIDIQRVQVFEGPPKVLQAMSVNHLMRTAAFKSSLFFDVRSEKLNRIFERHLKVNKKPVEPVTVPQTRAGEKPREVDVPTVRTDQEIVEDVGMRAGMHSLPGRTDVLADTTREKGNPEDFEIPTAGGLQKESLLGMPMSRIISAAIEPPDMERINAVPVSPTPRAQQLQGKRLDSDMHSSWFHSTKENVPRAKYKEFNYVYKKLQEYWSLFEIQGMEKSISLREFFNFEVDSCVANFLTVLRIVDKLSLRRKLVLEYKNRDVLIRPFENPFVSEKQLLLKEKEPIL